MTELHRSWSGSWSGSCVVAEGLYEEPGERLTGRDADLHPTVDSGDEANEEIDERK